MVKQVEVDGVSYGMRADGATPFLFKSCFGQDLIKIFTGAAAENPDVDIDGMAKELAYVMVKQAEQPDPTKIKLSFNDFLLWVSKFEPLSLSMASEDILAVYVDTTKTSSVAKKNSD